MARWAIIRNLWFPAFKHGILQSKVINSNVLKSDSVSRKLTSGEAFTALKPFFFAVHPDLFGQFPKERAINENSLKQLNAYIEASTLDRPTEFSHNSYLTFYLRNGNGNQSKVVSTTPVSGSVDGQFQSVKVILGQKDVRKTVHSILEKCNLPTSYIDSIPALNIKNNPFRPPFPNSASHPDVQYTQEYYWDRPKDVKNAEKINEKVNKEDSLRIWLERNVAGATSRLQECLPMRDEIVRLKQNVCELLGVNDVLWECGWGSRHFRGCLQSFLSMANHHPDNMDILKGKTIIFGGDTGINLDGHVILNSGEVRANWLDLIKRINKHNDVISRIPSVENALSRVLKDINIVHRKFEPTRMADSYESNLRKLITSVGDYRGRCKFPTQWPEKLSHLELVVETDSGPLMLSPTGQIIVPSSCPPFLLVNFITEKMNEASEKLAQYKRQKYEEKDLHSKCMMELGLFALEKADNITPDLMIDCIGRLLSRSTEYKQILNGSHLWITTYYSVQSDGEMCIPWNWK